MPTTMLERQKKKIVDILIDQRLLEERVQRARAEENLSVSDAEVQRKFEKFKEKFPNEANYARFLERIGETERSLREDMRESLELKKMIRREMGVRVTDDDVEKYYRANRSRFVEDERVKVRHILIKVSEGASAKKIAEAKKRAEELAERAREKNADFAEIARANSEGPSARSGGLLDYFTHEMMVEPFSRAAFALEAGEISSPVRTKFGFHVIQLVDRRSEKTIPLEDVRERLRAQLENRRLREATRELTERLRKKADIEIYEENIEITR
jgi:parvulin-like peptidyl-prolyl isomerase